MYNYFKEYHPVSVLLYTTGILILILLIHHPVYICTTLIGITIQIALFANIKQIIKSLIYALPILIIVIIINPLFNHKGNTPLFYYDGQPYTQEALLYGLFAASLILCFLIWYHLFNLMMDSYRLLYLFGKAFPAITLMITMTLRFIPYYKYQLQTIANVQKPLVQTLKQNMVSKFKNACNTFSCITSISLEGSIDTADSMKARGYGLRKRTHYERYVFLIQDWFLLFFIAFTFTSILFGVIKNIFYFNFFPQMAPLHFQKTNQYLFFVFVAYLLLPIILNILEEIKWTLSKRKI